MRLLLPVIFFLFLVNRAGAQETIHGSFMHGGIKRTFSFYVPAIYRHGDSVPLLIRLHGYGSSGQVHARNGDFRPIADTANFIIAHPDGSVQRITKKRFWNFGNVMDSKVDDVGFIEALIDTIALRYSINTKKIYAAGMSNGSFMCYYLACRSDRFAAIAAVTGSMGRKMFSSCETSTPISVIQISGTKDKLNPYKGNIGSRPIDEVIDFWVKQNGCDPQPVVTAIPDVNETDGATAEHYLYTNTVNGNSVELFKITGGGHTWPGFRAPNPHGNTCMDFDASREIWRFVRKYERQR